MSKKKMSANQLAVWDFTFYPGDMSVDDFVEKLQPLFKKWVFQTEEAPTTGRLHFQGRGSLIKKKRENELCCLINTTPLKGMEISISSCNSLKSDVFYALKYDSRIDGPWSDVTWTKPAYIPRQFRGLENRLYPWQKAILESRNTFDDRTINLLYNPEGCQGKSTIARLAELHHQSLRLPPVGDHKQLLEAACDILMCRQNRTPGLAFVDLPRSLTLDKRKFGPFMIAIEEIKGGVVCDMRNHYKQWWFDSPQMWVFCNHFPNVSYMSKDRWRFWKIDQFKCLVRMTESDLSQLSQSPEN